MSHPLTLDDLALTMDGENRISRVDLLDAVIVQVQKDFSPGTEIELDTNDLQGSFNAVYKALDLYSAGLDLHSIMRIAYRMDVKEKMVLGALNIPDRQQALEQITVIMIFRCLQKVLTRKFYS